MVDNGSCAAPETFGRGGPALITRRVWAGKTSICKPPPLFSSCYVKLYRPQKVLGRLATFKAARFANKICK